MIKWKRIVNESIDEKSFKKLLRQNGVTKLPSGTKLSYDGKLEWSKHKGHAGQKTIRNMCIQLEHAGWKRGDWTTGGIPDGSSVANSQTYTSPDGKILMSYTEYYGCTSYDNSFYITFKLVGDGLVSEGDDDDWDSDKPLVYKYHEDEPISVEEFVDKVRSEQQNIEDTFIQCSEVYENADEPWELFCDDMCDGKSPEEAFGLDYYMNKAARDQLPDDIAKYVYANDFDAMQWLHGIFEHLMPICKDPIDESTIKGTGRVDFDDDVVAVYDTKGKLEYKGLFDDCPYKDEPMQYDRKNMVYRFEGENGDYRTMAKLAESRMRYGDMKRKINENAEEREYSIECWVPCNKTFKVMASDSREAKQKVEAEVKELLKAPPETVMDVLKNAGFEIIPDPETWLDTYADAY